MKNSKIINPILRLFIVFSIAVIFNNSDCTPSPEPTPIPSEKPFWGGEVKSDTSFKYGRFIAKMKPMRKPGVVSTFFTYENVFKNEIDIEFVDLFNSRNQFEINFHYGELNNRENASTIYLQNFPQLNFNTDDDFHIYSFEWTPSYIEWFVDGISVKRYTSTDKPSIVNYLTHAQHIMLNIWTPVDLLKYTWAGGLNENDLPVSIQYDWVKHYAWDENTGFDSNPDFEDSFYNLKKWVVTHNNTFEDNNSVFVQENSIPNVKDGYLTLWLTKRGILPPDENYLIVEDFESYPVSSFPSSGGWILKYNGAGDDKQRIVSDFHVSGSNSMRMEGMLEPPFWWAAVMYNPVEMTNSIFYLEGMILGSDSGTGVLEDGGAMDFSNRDEGEWGTPYAGIGFDAKNGTIGCAIGDASQVIQSFTANQWYKVKMRFDVPSSSIDVWIDDVQKVFGLHGTVSPLGFTSISLTAAHGHTIFYYDDIKVWTE